MEIDIDTNTLNQSHQTLTLKDSNRTLLQIIRRYLIIACPNDRRTAQRDNICETIVAGVPVHPLRREDQRVLSSPVPNCTKWSWTTLKKPSNGGDGLVPPGIDSSLRVSLVITSTASLKLVMR